MTNVVRTERERIDVRRAPGLTLRHGPLTAPAEREGRPDAEAGRSPRMRSGVRSWIRRLLQVGR